MEPLRTVVTRDRTLTRRAKALAEATTKFIVATRGAGIGLHVPTKQDQTAKNAPGAEAATFVASVPEELSPGKKPESSCCGSGRGWRACVTVFS